MRYRTAGALIFAGAAVLILIAAFALASDDEDEPSASASPSPSATIPRSPTTTATASPSPDSPVSATPIPSATAPAASTPAGPPVSPTEPLPASDLPALPAGTERVNAPIDGLEVLTLESFPPQYVIRVSAGLPNGCAQPAGYEASRSADLIEIRVHNSLPEAQVVCTAIYGMYELSIALGSRFESGLIYTIQVNDQSVNFTAQ